MVSCAVGVGKAMSQVFRCGLVEASEMFLLAAWGVLGRYCVFPPWLVWDRLAVSSYFVGAVWNVCAAHKQMWERSISGLSHPAFTWAC